MQTLDLLTDQDTLADALNARGIRFLAAGYGAPVEISDDTLIASVVSHPSPTLRAALTPLFLLHPELASLVSSLAPVLSGPARQELVVRYQAAVYLQRLWRTRLGFYLGAFRDLPDLFSAELGLPAAEEHFGKAGLEALAEWHKEHSEYPYNHLSTYNHMLDLLLEQLQRQARRDEHASFRQSRTD
jgi:hypothetical protein